MIRTARKNITASYIHIITQGIDKENIFQEQEYKNKYIKLVQETFEKYSNLYLLCYCIMDNHAHFLIYTEDNTELSKAMARINTTYGGFYNKRENRVGYVFRNRYYTQPIKDEAHLYSAFVYIHRNPVKANLVKEMEEYQFSSYQQYQEGKISEKCIELLFQTQEYKERFNLIHRNFVEGEDVFDIAEAPIVTEEVEIFVEKFCEKVGIKRGEIRKNRNNKYIMQIVKEIRERYYYNNKEITNILGIGKNRIRNIKRELEK